MKRTNITKPIFLITILVLMQNAIFAQKAELVVQTGHTEGISSVAFSPDGKTLVSASLDRTIKLWDVQTRQELKTFSGHTSRVFTVVFSPDGKTLASGSADQTIKLWDVQTGQELKTLSGHTSSIESVEFSPDGKTLASGSWDNTIELWDIQTGKELKTFTGHTLAIQSVTFSPDGKMIASASADQTIKLWDLVSGHEIRTLSGHNLNVESVKFSPNSKTLVSASLDKTIKLWDVQTGQEIKTLSGHTDQVFTVVFSPDGKTLASGSADQTIKLWDVQTGQELKTLSGRTSSIGSVAFSPDGKTLASNSDKTIKLWDLQTGREITTLSGHINIVTGVAFSPNGKILASANYDQTIKLWDGASGQKLTTLSGISFVSSVVFSPDGKTIASGNLDKTINLWDLQTGQKLKTFTGHTSVVWSVAFSPDGKTIASGSSDKTIKLWDAESGYEIKTLSGQIGSIELVTFSPDGKTLASASYDSLSDYHTIIFWDVASGILIKSFNVNDPNTVSEVLAIVPDYYQKSAYAPITPDGRFQIKGSDNGKLKLFEVKTGKLLASLFAIDEDDWVVIDPEGRFDASPGAQKLMHFVVGLEPVDLEQIKDRYYTPNLLQRIFKGENLDATRQVSVFTADELYPLAEFSPLGDGQTKVDVKLTNRGGGIGRMQVFVNGAEFLADARPKGFDPKSKSGEFTIDFSAAKTLKRGESNDIRIIARNEAGWLRNRGTEIVYLDDRKKDDAPQEFYAIIGGVSEYENKDFNLRYSAKDARDFARATELGAVKLFGRDHVHIRLLASGAGEENAVLTGADSKVFAPTKENFKQTFEEFRKAKPTDVFVVYLAGHGTSINKGGDTGDTYLYLTQEAVTTDKSRLLDDKLRNATTVSSEELAEWIRDVPALKRAMILDTCAAGAVEASLTKARDLSPDQIKALDRMKDRTGFYVLMGSAADAQSYEATRYGQGLLTYSLLQGMSGAKLRDGEYADVSTLFNYAEDTVVEMAKGIGGIQQPRIIAPTESRSFDIGRFSTVEKGKFTLAKVKPLILQPKFFNINESFDDLELSNSVEKALRDESSTVSRGDAEAKLVFVEANEMNDAVTPSGVYEVIGDQIKVTLKLIINKKPYKTVTVEGSAANKEALSRKIVAAIIANAPN